MADRMNFADLFYRHQVLPGGSTTSQGVSPTGIHLGHGVKVVSTEKSFEAGGLTPTDNPHHIAIEGGNNLFFRIVRANGDTAYTRAGNFTLNETGQFVTPAGDFLDPGIIIPQETPLVQIRSDGIVTASDGVSIEEEVGQITLHRSRRTGCRRRE